MAPLPHARSGFDCLKSPENKKDLEQRGIRILRYANSTSLQVLPHFE
ncbi:hypothetical protein HMPREF3231_00122 [Bifidobacterium longum]|nr:hypothetical protein HMPREF3231_00122 [Bifidobacterium longum]